MKLFSAAREHVIAGIAGAPIRREPFTHVVLDGVFPPDFYAAMMAHLPPSAAYRPLAATGRVSGGYSKARLCLFPSDLKTAAIAPAMKDFWQTFFRTFGAAAFAQAWIERFRGDIERHLVDDLPAMAKAGHVVTRFEVFLIRDLETYALGPHTDSEQKLVSVLFYLAREGDDPSLGTALYTPKERGRVCAGGPHHRVEEFERVATAPYRPNAVFAFPKTRTSFHGVEPVRRETARRDLLLFDIKLG